MTERLIRIPILNDSARDFDCLFEIWSQVNGYFEDVRFDFSQCNFLRPNAVAFLGGLARLINWRMGSAVFDWDSLTDGAVRMNLRQNGFTGAFGENSAGWGGNSIPYREDAAEDPEGILDYLTDYWLGRGWVKISPKLRDAIVGRMWEIYANSFEHSSSPVGVSSCGQHFQRRNELILSVVDFGLGIVANVRNFLSSDPRANQLTAAQCLHWAFRRGTSTRPNGMARGLGLDLLKEFIRVNDGKLEVYSNEGYALIDKENERFVNRSITFEGTIFHVTLRCDERYYRFADEGR